MNGSRQRVGNFKTVPWRSLDGFIRVDENRRQIIYLKEEMRSYSSILVNRNSGDEDVLGFNQTAGVVAEDEQL